MTVGTSPNSTASTISRIHRHNHKNNKVSRAATKQFLNSFRSLHIRCSSRSSSSSVLVPVAVTFSFRFCFVQFSLSYVQLSFLFVFVFVFCLLLCSFFIVCAASSLPFVSVAYSLLSTRFVKFQLKFRSVLRSLMSCFVVRAGGYRFQTEFDWFVAES